MIARYLIDMVDETGYLRGDLATVAEKLGAPLADVGAVLAGAGVNALAPGHVDTSKLRGQLDATRRVIAANTPAGRLAEPEEIAHAVLYLVSPQASFITGQVLSLNGGDTIVGI